MPKNKVRYEARLIKDFKRNPYGIEKTYKKGTVIWEGSEKEFDKLFVKGKHAPDDLRIIEGFGVYEYFRITDVEFVRLETKSSEKSHKINLK